MEYASGGTRRLLLVLLCAVIAAPLPAGGGPENADNTWIEVGGTVYGCVPDSTGPVGGGNGYTRMVATGEHEAISVEQLIAGLHDAGPGETVYIPGEAVLDFTSLVLAGGFALQIPPGVTLASDRGAGGSAGALLKSDAYATSPLIRIEGPGARITGLRIRGPDPERDLAHWRRSFWSSQGERQGLSKHEYYYQFPASRGVATEYDGLEVDNCELSGWSLAAVFLAAGRGHHLHHNFIHHNQRQGLGYGISHGTAFSVIEYNLFDWNRHSISGTGQSPSGYVARYNLETGHSLSHSFDMHGGRDRKDGTSTAGSRIEIYNNTFLGARRAISIRGRPEECARIFGNWFAAHGAPGPAVVWRWPSADTVELGRNLYGRITPGVQ
jgi:hypothetical protein